MPDCGFWGAYWGYGVLAHAEGSVMMRWIMMLVFVGFMGGAVQSSTITAHLELVLSQSEELMSGPMDVTVSLVGPDQAVRWQEVHKNVYFFDGAAAFEIGQISEIKTLYLYDKGVQLIVAISDDSIVLPMYSTPFSLFSHAADIVNAIHMDGVFHTDLVNKRIGINIDVPTPSVRLEVNGAMKLGDDPLIDDIGTIRWRNNRLEGRHNHLWNWLDVSPADGFESKWDENFDPTDPGFYVNGPTVLIKATNILATLTVEGDVYVDQAVTSAGKVSVSGRLNLLDGYGVSLNADVYARSVTLNADNVFNFSEGLIVSGILTGKGHGVTHVSSSNMRSDAIQNIEISPLAIDDMHIADDAVTHSKIQLASISSDKLHASFKLTNDYFLAQVVTNNKVKRGSVHEDDLSLSFSLTPFHFMDASIVSRNIGAGEIDYVKINDDELDVLEFAPYFIDAYSILADDSVSSINVKDGSIEADDFLPGSLTYNHFDSIISIDKGGTHQQNYGLIGELLLVSNNQVISDPNFMLKTAGLGIQNTNPTVRLDIQQSAGLVPLRIQSTQPSSVGVEIKNDIGHWYIGLSGSSNVAIKDQLNGRRMLSMERSNGHIGFRGEAGIEKMTVHGGVLLGDKSVADVKPGTMYFDQASTTFKLRNETGISFLQLGPILPTDMIPSYMYARHIQNESERSRVFLADDVALFGNGHSVSGAFQSVIDGEGHVIDFMQNSLLSGRFSQLRMVQDSQFFGHDLTGAFVHEATVFGAKQSVQFLAQSRVDGQGHVLSHVSKGVIDGGHHRVLFSDQLQVIGSGHDVNMARAMTLVGQDHSVRFSNNASLLGQSNELSHVSVASVDGAHNVLSQSHSVVVEGQSNQLAGARHATVVGDRNHIVHGSGVYLGNRNRHYGVGSPTVIGKNNVLIGDHSAGVYADSVVSIGSSTQDLDDGYGIHFHAPGGVDIVSGELTLAYLAPHGGSWSHVSDKALKINIESLDPKFILSKVMALPVMEWSYKGQHYIQHIGPMAQDFYSMFQLGNNNRYIQSVDMDGVIFSSIQGLGQTMNLIKMRRSVLGQKEKEAGKGVVGLSNQLDSLTVSGNQLIQMDERLNHRFHTLHDQEFQQIQYIKQLNEEIVRLKKRWERGR